MQFAFVVTIRAHVICHSQKMQERKIKTINGMSLSACNHIMQSFYTLPFAFLINECSKRVLFVGINDSGSNFLN